MKVVTKNTHIHLQKRLLVTNQKYIEMVCGLSADQYFTAQVEMACQFLENKYDRNNEAENREYLYLTNEPLFWKWWNHEFNLFVKRHINDHLFSSHTGWYRYIDLILTDVIIQAGFKNQLPVILKLK